MSPGGSPPGRDRHWDAVYAARRPTEVSWYQRDPRLSLALIEAAGVAPDDPIIDVGAGASYLVDRLLERGFADVTVLDVSELALQRVRERLGGVGARVAVVRTDVLAFEPARAYALWHDRAVFHFLTDPDDRRRYVDVLSRAVRPGGHVVIATFAPDGPPKCSGLPVERYDAEALSATLGAGFELLRAEEEAHRTPSGAVQPFQYGLFRAG